MKIVRAQKEISRLNGEVKDIKHRLQGCLSTVEGNEFTESFGDLFQLYQERLSRVSGIKDAVHKANVSHDMHKYIVMLGELKQHLAFVKELDPKSGKHERGYRENLEMYVSQITIQSKVDAVTQIQQEINRITDLLDEFNASTDIGEVEGIVLNLPVMTKVS